LRERRSFKCVKFTRTSFTIENGCHPEPPFLGGEGSLEWLEGDPFVEGKDDIFGEEWLT
jgi:hypothetical protein